MSNLNLENDDDSLPVCPSCQQRVCPPEDSGQLVNGVYYCGDCLIKAREAAIEGLQDLIKTRDDEIERLRQVIHVAAAQIIKAPDRALKTLIEGGEQHVSKD